MKFSLVIPMYNESGILDATLRSIAAFLDAAFPDDDCEVVFSDDGSTDGSRQKVEAFGHPKIRAVGYEKNCGKGSAVRNGILNAAGDVILFTDCDLAYGLDVVKEALAVFDREPDTQLVIGSRNLTGDGYEGYTLWRKAASKIYIRCLAIAAGFRLSDSQCGFKGFRRDAARTIFSACEVDGFAFDFEALIKANNLGYKITEMPVKVINHRQSKVRVLRDSVKMLRDVRGIRKRNPPGGK